MIMGLSLPPAFFACSPECRRHGGLWWGLTGDRTAGAAACGPAGESYRAARSQAARGRRRHCLRGAPALRMLQLPFVPQAGSSGSDSYPDLTLLAPDALERR